MRSAVVLLAIAVLILSTCAPQAAPTAAMSPPPSETLAPSATPAPTATPTKCASKTCQ
jgi:PBP1b-binding outer membrane lipoprotein LpoB